LFSNNNIYKPFLLILRAQGVSGESETTCPSTVARRLKAGLVANNNVKNVSVILWFCLQHSCTKSCNSV